MKCTTCRKAEVLDSRWDKIRIRLFHIFHNDIVDLSQEKYTQGFSDGYVKGREHQREDSDKQIAAVLESRDPELTQFPLVIDPEKVIKSNAKGELFLNSIIVSQEKVETLKREVIMFKNSLLWEILSNTIAHQAEEAGWKRSESLQDLMNAKAMVRAVDIQKNIIINIENAK